MIGNNQSEPVSPFTLLPVLKYKQHFYFVEKLSTPVCFKRNIFRDMNSISPIGSSTYYVLRGKFLR